MLHQNMKTPSFHATKCVCEATSVEIVGTKLKTEIVKGFKMGAKIATDCKIGRQNRTCKLSIVLK